MIAFWRKFSSNHSQFENERENSVKKETKDLCCLEYTIYNAAAVVSKQVELFHHSQSPTSLLHRWIFWLVLPSSFFQVDS